MTESLSVTVTRDFDAPIDLVYAAWMDAEQVTQWMKCDSSAILTCESWEPAQGATYSTTMEMPGAWKVQGSGRFTEVDPPRLLAYTGDANEEMQMPEMHVRVELEELDGNRTRLTLTHSGIPNDMICGVIKGGWTNSFQMLSERIAVAS